MTIDLFTNTTFFSALVNKCINFVKLLYEGISPNAHYHIILRMSHTSAALRKAFIFLPNWRQCLSTHASNNINAWNGSLRTDITMIIITILL